MEDTSFLAEGAVLMGSPCVVWMSFAGTMASGSPEALRFLPAALLTSSPVASDAEPICLEVEASPLEDALSLGGCCIVPPRRALVAVFPMTGLGDGFFNRLIRRLSFA